MKMMMRKHTARVGSPVALLAAAPQAPPLPPNHTDDCRGDGCRGLDYGRRDEHWVRAAGGNPPLHTGEHVMYRVSWESAIGVRAP